jgi:predicted transposase/invertase (TIGR01784 family)
MKSCLEEYKDCEVNEIADKYIEGTPCIEQAPVHPDEVLEKSDTIIGMNSEEISLTEKNISYDLRFVAIAPQSGDSIKLIINVEAQNDFYPGYPLIKRGIYYCSRMISSQYGTEFTNEHYGEIKKVYSIWICMNPPKNRENTITRYRITEDNLIGHNQEKQSNYDLMTVIMLYLGSHDTPHYDGILKLLEVLLSNETQAEEKKKILSEDFNIAMTEEFESEVYGMCNLSKGVEERGIAKGLEQGRMEGLSQGLSQGRMEEKYDIAKNLKQQGVDLSLIQNATGLSLDELHAL